LMQSADEVIEKCKHGMIKDGFCYDCHEEKINIEFVIKEKEKFSMSIADPANTLKRFNVPTKYRNCSFDSYQGNDKAISECKKYKSGGLVLFGNTGCGKTHLSISVMRNKLINDLRVIIEREWPNGRCYEAERQYFVTVPDLLLEIRGSFYESSEKKEADVIEWYSEIPFLVLDDLGSEKTSEYAITTLYIIIDRRDREELSTVVTTNLSLSEIDEKLSARIASRLSGWKNIKINMPDYRKKR
jgi:DNA replication protein DnaC